MHSLEGCVDHGYLDRLVGFEWTPGERPALAGTAATLRVALRATPVVPSFSAAVPGRPRQEGSFAPGGSDLQAPTLGLNNTVEGWEVCTDRETMIGCPTRKLDLSSVEADAPSCRPASSPMGGEP